MELKMIAMAVMVLVLAHSSWAVYITVDVNHQQLVREGTNITFLCRAEDPAAEAPVIRTLEISKLMQGYGDNERVFVGSSFTSTYKNYARYSSRFYQEGNSFFVEIKISGIKKEDSGEFHCLDTEEDVGASKTIEVFKDIDSVGFLNQDNNLTVWYKDSINVTCVVDGGIPAPVAHLTAGDRHLTDFTRQVFSHRVDSRVLEPSYIDHRVHYTDLSFTPNPEDDGKELTCQAHIPGATFEPKSAGVMLEVIQPPHLFDCKTKQYGLLHEKGVIECSVVYNPLGTSYWTFKWGGSEVTLANNATSDGQISSKMVRQPEGTRIHEQHLLFDSLFDRHFITYTIHAHNEHGHVTEDITLIHGVEPSGASAVASTVAPLLVALLTTWFHF